MKPRRNASMENAKCYAPQILVGTEGLPREQWLEYRRKGIGGSDAAAVLGISPFRTGRDLYYDKLNRMITTHRHRNDAEIFNFFMCFPY